MDTDRTVTTVIDPEKCIGCGLCIPVCPKETISLEDGKARVTGAESLMGLGTCLIGYVIEAMKRDKRITQSIGLPKDETPYAVIALGYPNERYEKVAGRKSAILRCHR